MAENTIIQQGRFKSNGKNKFLVLRADIDWIRVYNETVSYAAGAGNGAEFYWQRGMAQSRGVVYTKEATIGALVPSQIAALSGFTIGDTSTDQPGPPITITNIVGNGGVGGSPRVTAANHGLNTAGGPAIVRMNDIKGASQLAVSTYEVRVFDDNNFDLIFMPSIVNAAAPGANAVVRDIGLSSAARGYFFPQRQFISQVTAGATTVVRTTETVLDAFDVGDFVRFTVPSLFGMTELDGLQGKVLSRNHDFATGVNTITVDIDSSSFTAFAYPTDAQVIAAGGSFNPAQVTPVGGPDLSKPVLDDDQIFVKLGAGAGGPAGQLDDVIYWVAGKSFSVDNS